MMSVAISADKVTGVLLADTWHDVVVGTFQMLGAAQAAGLPGPCAGWKDPDGMSVACQLSAILAVRTAKPAAQREERSLAGRQTATTGPLIKSRNR